MASFLGLLMLLLVAFNGVQKVQADSKVDALASVPKCALSCLFIAISTSGCGSNDLECQCNSPYVETNATTCIKSKCSIEDALVAKNATQTHCGAPIRDKRTEFNAVTIVMTSLSVSVVIIRIGFKKFCVSGGLRADDWFILVTAVAVVVSAALNIALLSNNGMGTDIWTLDPATITAFSKGFYINGTLYFADVSILKLALLCFYKQIFPKRGIQRAIWWTMVFNIVFGSAFVLGTVFQCTPISYTWTKWHDISGGTCIDISGFAQANATVSIVLDLWMLVIPMSQLRSLQLHWKKKVGVAAMFGVGTFITVVSAIRLSSLVNLRHSDNPTWDYASVSQWSSIEITVGVICASMPSMRMVLVRLFPAFFGSIPRRARDEKNSKGTRSGRNAPDSEGDTRKEKGSVSTSESPRGEDFSASWVHDDAEAAETSDVELGPYVSQRRESDHTNAQVPTSPLNGWFPDDIRDN